MDELCLQRCQRAQLRLSKPIVKVYEWGGMGNRLCLWCLHSASAFPGSKFVLLPKLMKKPRSRNILPPEGQDKD